MKNALETQVAGDHYKNKAIQPVEFIHANNIPFIEGNCIKYLVRWRDKGGVKDLEKVKHYVDLLIELEAREANRVQVEYVFVGESSGEVS
jgi:hypothetical protein